MGSYGIILAVAAGGTWLSTFVIKRLAVRFHFVVLPDDRRVHERATPVAGGVAMFLGFLVAMALASQLKQFHEGGDPGFSAFEIRYPKEKAFVIVLSNLENSPVRVIANDLAALSLDGNIPAASK